MAEINRKTVRTLANQFSQETNEALLKRWADPQTAEAHEAMIRAAREKGLELPETHGAIEEPSEAEQPKKVISLEELGTTVKTEPAKKFAFGWSEGISLFAGVGITLGLWPSSKGIALFYGVVIAVVLYGILHYTRRTWKELGETELKGTDMTLRGKKRK